MSPKTSLLLVVIGVPVLAGSLWILAVICAATGYPLPNLFADRSQPVAYPHNRHVALGMECTACHFGAETGNHAGIPPTSFCASCHLLTPTPVNATAATTNTVVASVPTAGRWAAPTPPQMAGFLEEKLEIPWKQFERAPRHVFFSHRRHVVIAKLDCTACHGDMSQRKTPVTKAVFPQHLPGMNRCVACHLKEKVTTDCVACHH